MLQLKDELVEPANSNEHESRLFEPEHSSEDHLIKSMQPAQDLTFALPYQGEHRSDADQVSLVVQQKQAFNSDEVESMLV